MHEDEVPEDFRRDTLTIIGRYVVGQTRAGRYERWDIFEDAAHHFARVARKSETERPEQTREQR